MTGSSRVLAGEPGGAWPRQCAAVIPCHNEAASIGEVVTGARRHLPTVIVVDDGSTDTTAQIAAGAGAEVVCLPGNTGKGAALRAGWQHARERGFAWALNLDGDGQHAPEDIPKFFECAARTHAAMIVGNRMGRARTMPRLRRWTNRWMSRRLSQLSGVPLPDSQCGFRLLDLEVAARLPLSTNRFEIESELLLAAITSGYPVAFVPVRVIYKSGGSRIHPVADGWRWLRWWAAQPRPWRMNPVAVHPRMNDLLQPHA